MIRSIILIFLCFLINGCQQSKTPDELKDFFYYKKPDLDRLISSLANDKKLDSLFEIPPDSGLPNIKEQYPEEYKILKNCGITDASSHQNSFPKGTKWYYFRTNWHGQYPILLSCDTRNSYDSLERKKGFYKNDHYSNEWWGLGDGWQMLQLVRTIDYIKQ